MIAIFKYREFGFFALVNNVFDDVYLVKLLFHDDCKTYYFGY
jgi:hypothetical protein